MNIVTKNFVLYTQSIIIFFFLTFFSLKQQELKNSISDYKEKLVFDTIKIRMLMDMVLMHSKQIDFRLNPNTIITDSANNYVMLNDLIKGEKFIYYFNEKNCFTCVENYLPFIQKISDKLGKDKVLILGTYSIKQNLFLALSKFDLRGLKIYNTIDLIEKNEKISQLNSPFIFKVDSFSNVSKIFIPEKDLPELSELYNSKILPKN